MGHSLYTLKWHISHPCTWVFRLSLSIMVPEQLLRHWQAIRALYVCARWTAHIFSLGKNGFWAWSLEASAKRKDPVFSSPWGVMHSPRQWKTIPRAFPITHTPRPCCQGGPSLEITDRWRDERSGMWKNAKQMVRNTEGQGELCCFP